MSKLSLVIKGNLLSKSNSRQFTSYGGKPRLIKNKKALEFEESALWQLKSQLRDHQVILDEVRIVTTIFYSSKRPDLDVSLLQDILEKAGVYKNDRQVHEIHAIKKLDRDNPRVLVEVERLYNS